MFGPMLCNLVGIVEVTFTAIHLCSYLKDCFKLMIPILPHKEIDIRVPATNYCSPYKNVKSRSMQVCSSQNFLGFVLKVKAARCNEDPIIFFEKFR